MKAKGSRRKVEGLRLEAILVSQVLPPAQAPPRRESLWLGESENLSLPSHPLTQFLSQDFRSHIKTVLQCCSAVVQRTKGKGMLERWNGGMGGMLEEWKKKNVTSSGLAS